MTDPAENERISTAPSLPRRAPSAAARALWLFVAIAIAATALPLVIHFTGFAPAANVELAYPKLSGYLLRKTPDMAGHHGLDFSQVYLASRKLSNGGEVYERVDLARWRRVWSSTYHPFAHWLYRPIAAFGFQRALVFHNLLGISLLLAAGFLALRAAGAARDFPAVASASLMALYLTPTGLLHMERGQFDLFTAASYACVFALFATGGGGWAVAAAVLSSLKVTSWAFVAPYWFVATLIRGWRERTPWLLPAGIAGLLLVFASQVLDWLPAVRYVAENVATRGVSFTRILPQWLAQGLPFVSVAALASAAWLALRRENALSDSGLRAQLLARVSFPFAAALAIQALGFTPVTHDYRLVALLGLLPACAIWGEANPRVAYPIKLGVSLLYVATLVVGMRVRPFFGAEYVPVTWALLVASLVFLAASLTLARTWRAERSGSAEVRGRPA